MEERNSRENLYRKCWTQDISMRESLGKIKQLFTREFNKRQGRFILVLATVLNLDQIETYNDHIDKNRLINVLI